MAQQAPECSLQLLAELSEPAAVEPEPSAIAENPVKNHVQQEPAPALVAAESSSRSTQLLARSASAVMIAPAPQLRFDWTAAMRQSSIMLGVQQGLMLATDRWSRHNIAHGKFLKDYWKGVRGNFSTWDDGDPFIDNYIGHPLQGAVTGFIQVQNDPRYRNVQLGEPGYWRSRLRATGFTALYSSQFEIGLISEASIQNLGAFDYRNCPTCKLTRGAGWVDHIITPAGGFAWMFLEDALDRHIVNRYEERTNRGRWTKLLRTALNPGRAAANLLRLKAPWHRDSRDGVYLRNQPELPPPAVETLTAAAGQP